MAKQLMLPRSTALSLLFGGAVAAAQPAFAQTAATPIAMGSMAIDSSGESYYGAESGIYARYGIDPKITTLSNGTAITTAVITGDLEVGQSNPLPIATAISRGIQLQVIATGCLIDQRDATKSLVVAKDGPVQTAKDLIGGAVGLSTLGDFNQLSVFAWLEKNGVARDSVKFIEMPYTQIAAALQRGTIKMGFLPQSFKAGAIKDGLIRVLDDSYSAVAPAVAVGVWFSTKAWAQKNPQTLRKLVTAIYDTARYANTHFPETGQMLARVAKLDPATVATMSRVYFATSNEKKYYENMLALAARYGFLQRPVSYEEYCPPLPTA